MKNGVFNRLLVLSLSLLSLMGCNQAPEPTPPPAVIEAAAQPPSTPVLLDTTTYFARCGGELRDMSAVLRPIVDDLVAQKIPYTRDPKNEWRDCSGNFLRLSSALAAACPDQADQLAAPAGVARYVAGNDNAVAFDVPYRSSRAVGKWYQEQGRFTPVFYDDAPEVADVPSDLLAIRDQIRPGAVVWFSRGRPVSSEGVGALFEKTATGSHINHMATVTDVVRDDDGEVISYTMFHGHGRASNMTPASQTNRQFFTWPAQLLANGTKSYPPLGYWSQRLVGVGTLLPVETMALPGDVR